jgi:hypothetical protein
MTVRSFRNCNPGNLRTGQPWIGLCPPDQMTPEQVEETQFCVFIRPDYGFRALGMTLLTYFRAYKLQTVNSIISRWAPANENDTRAYVLAVSKALNVQPTDTINVADQVTLSNLCKAIAVHEAGGWIFDNADLQNGVDMALGIIPMPIPPNDTGPIAA